MKINNYKYILILCIPLISLFSDPVHADDWRLKKNKKGIQVFTRDVPGSGFKEFKAITEVESSMTSIIKLMEDFPSYTEWFPKLKEVKLLKMINSRVLILYQIMELPFPADNRDCIFKVSASRNAGTNAVELQLTSLSDYIPERKGIVRVKKISGFWTFVPNKEKGTVAVTYQMHSEPGGKLPSWIANSAVVKRPFAVLKNMTEMLKKPYYRDAKESDLQLLK